MKVVAAFYWAYYLEVFIQTAAADGRRLAAEHTHVAYLLISTADSKQMARQTRQQQVRCDG